MANNTLLLLIVHLEGYLSLLLIVRSYFCTVFGWKVLVFFVLINLQGDPELMKCTVVTALGALK